MARRTAVALVAVVAIGLAAAVAALAAGPPSGIAGSLTANGRAIWNLDALLNDTFGDRTDCYDAKTTSIFSVSRSSGCPAPDARYETYVFTFLNAFGSKFRLVARSKPPFTGVSNVPLRVRGRYVSCPDGEYHHGAAGWLVAGGGTGPNGEFWCN